LCYSLPTDCVITIDDKIVVKDITGKIIALRSSNFEEIFKVTVPKYTDTAFSGRRAIDISHDGRWLIAGNAVCSMHGISAVADSWVGIGDCDY